MSKFIYKPLLVDFGHTPSTKVVKFIHECTTITMVSKPSWVYSVDFDYEPYVTGTPMKGTMTMTITPDTAVRKYSGFIELLCDTDEVYVPVIYSYDSECVPLKQVIDDLFLHHSDGSYINESQRMTAISIAKRWLQEHHGVAGTNV